MQHFLVPLVALLVLMLPGTALLGALRVHRAFNGALLVPLVALMSLALVMPPLWAALTAERPIRWVVFGIAAETFALAMLGIWRAVRSGTRLRSAQATMVEAVRRIEPELALVVLTSILVAALVQGAVQSDSLYHAAQALKLAALPAPSFDNTLQYLDGTAHPGYVLPVWQEVIAITGRAAHASMVEVSVLVPIVTVPVAALAWAGCSRTMFPVRGAALAGAAAYLSLQIFATWPRWVGVANVAQPGTIVLDVVLPVAIAAFLVAIRPGARVCRASACFVLAVATLLVGVLHVSYLMNLAFVVGGYLVAWAIAARPARAELLRHAAASALVLVVAAVTFAVLHPRIDTLQTYRTGTDPEAIEKVVTGIDKPHATTVGELFVGTYEEFHLRADYLVWPGGPALLGLIGALLLARERRSDAARMLVGWTAIVLVISQVDVIFTAMTGFAGAAQMRRLDMALPLVPALAWLMLVLARPLENLGRRRAALAAGIVAVATVVAVTPRLVDRTEDPVLPEWPVQLVALLMPMVLVAWAAMRVRDHRRRAADGDAPERIALPTPSRGPVALLALALILPSIIAGWGAFGDVRTAHERGLEQRAELATFEPELRARLRKLRPGSVVLGDVRYRTAFRVMAIAPVYVVSSAPGHVANTPDNRLEERYRRVERWFELRRIQPEERSNMLRHYRVSTIVIRNVPRFGDDRRALDGPLRSQWRLAYEDDDFVLYERRRPPRPR